jgi:CubicO group peptidase (beta-lactamase class C family)
MRRCLLSIFLFLPGIAAQAQTCAFTSAETQFSHLLASEALPGGAMLIGGRQGLLHEQYFGSYTASTVVAIASASKLLSALRIAQLVDSGAIDVDAPVAQYLPQFTGDKGTMSVRQMFSHTAGYGDDSLSPVLIDSSITLAQAVDDIACCRALNAGYNVGGQFSYGGVSMHIAGRVAEVQGGGDWQTQWQTRFGAPLGITSIDWLAFGPTTNYGIAGAGRSNLRDYGRALHPLVNAGRSNGIRVFSAAAAQNFAQDQVGTLPIAYAPPNVTPPVRYGMGSWIDSARPPGQPPLIHSLGAFGFFPWVDFDRQLFGVFMIRGTAGVNERALPVYTGMLQSIAQEVDASGCALIETFEEIFVDGFGSDT